MAHIVIIGNGISGITTARHIRKLSANTTITIVSAETDYFFSRTALMYIYMGHMRFEDTMPYETNFWSKNRINLKKGRVLQVDFKQNILHFENSDNLNYDKLVIATGSASNFFGWKGQDLNGVQGLYSYQDLQNMEKYTSGIERAVIIGGGLIGLEMVEMLQSRNIRTTMLVREKSFWNPVLPPQESAIVTNHIRNDHHVDLKLETELKEIKGTDGCVTSLITSKDEEIVCGFVGIAVGVHPNIDFLKNTELEINRGVLVDEYLLTNIPNVYAIGDCAEHRNPLPGRRPIEQVWYTGRMQGETIAYSICNKNIAYKPGVWFNSAKFMDIEYQTYGLVPVALPESQNELVWEHEDRKKLIRINYLKDSGTVMGFNLIGVRYRHEVCEQWLKNNAHIETVLAQLSTANFDPEFYVEFESSVRKLYNQKNNKTISSIVKRGLYYQPNLA